MDWVYIPLLLGLVMCLMLPGGRLAEVLWAEAFSICVWFSLAHLSGNSVVGCYPLETRPPKDHIWNIPESNLEPKCPTSPNHIQPIWTGPHSPWRCLSLRVFAVAEDWVWRRFVMKLYCGNSWLIKSSNLPHFFLSILRCHQYRNIHT